MLDRSSCQNVFTYLDAQALMLQVLASRKSALSFVVHDAVEQVLAGKLDAVSEEALRVGLWESIKGRDLELSREVLTVRAAICVLYAFVPEQPDPQDTLEYFNFAANEAGLLDSVPK